MWQTLSDAIMARVLASGKIDSANVFDYVPHTLPGYPCAVIIPSSGTGVIADTTRKQRLYTFRVRIYQERIQQGVVQSEVIMRSFVDDLIGIFDDDTAIQAAITGLGFMAPVTSTWAFIQGEDIDTRVAEVLVNVTVIQ